MAIPDLSQVSWRKSSRSGNQGECVEIASLPNATAIRDSKNPNGGAVILSGREWSALRSVIKSGDLDLA